MAATRVTATYGSQTVPMNQRFWPEWGGILTELERKTWLTMADEWLALARSVEEAAALARSVNEAQEDQNPS